MTIINGDVGDAIEKRLRPSHKCKPVAKITNMAPGRDWWLGKLIEPVKDWPEETHCLHIKTPLKDIVLLVNMGDLQGLATLNHCVFPITSLEWLDRMSLSYQKATIDFY